MRSRDTTVTLLLSVRTLHCTQCSTAGLQVTARCSHSQVHGFVSAAAGCMVAGCGALRGGGEKFRYFCTEWTTGSWAGLGWAGWDTAAELFSVIYDTESVSHISIKQTTDGDHLSVSESQNEM